MYNVIKGDCLEGLLATPDEVADLILIDAPYFNYKTSHRKDKEDKLSQSLVQQTQEDQLRTVQECIRVLKTGCAFFYFTNWQEAWWFQARFHTFLRNEIIWDKGNWTAGDLTGSLGNKYEVAFLGTKGKGWKVRGPRIHDIWGENNSLPRMGTNRIHATEKPVDLYQKCIEIATDPGAFIIDPYGGSGSSCEAAVRMGRDILVWEIDPEYHARILTRMERVPNGTTH